MKLTHTLTQKKRKTFLGGCHDTLSKPPSSHISLSLYIALSRWAGKTGARNCLEFSWILKRHISSDRAHLISWFSVSSVLIPSPILGFVFVPRFRSQRILDSLWVPEKNGAIRAGWHHRSPVGGPDPSWKTGPAVGIGDPAALRSLQGNLLAAAQFIGARSSH